jgi:hypothetical protein
MAVGCPVAKKERLVGRDDNFGGAFAGAVRVVPTHRVAFPVAVNPLLVFVTLVGRNQHGCPHGRCATDRFQNMGRALGINGERGGRIAVTLQHQRLGSQVEYDFRLFLRKNGLHLLQIADVGAVIPHTRADTAPQKNAVGVLRIEGNAGQVGAQLMQPDAEPGAFETGMARDEDFFIFKGGKIHFLFF